MTTFECTIDNFSGANQRSSQSFGDSYATCNNLTEKTDPGLLTKS